MVNTSNAYGKITITNQSIAIVTSYIARDCYGVVDLHGQKLANAFSKEFNKKQLNKGVKIITINNRIYIDIYVILRYGVAIGAVAESIKNTIKYGVESFTGMIVDSVNINVAGVRL